MNEEKFTIPFIEFVSKNYEIDEHFFLITGNNKYIDRNSINKKNIYFLNDDNFNILYLTKLMNESQQILIHGFFQNFRFKLLLLLNYKNLKKVNWIIWGGDLYYSNSSMSIKHKINDILKKFLVKRFGYVSTLVKTDYDVAKNKYKITGIYKKAMYLTPIKLEFLDSIIPESKECCNIQIGNSADISNLHLDVIDKLSKFKDENIKIYCPLSYGDKDYGKKVEEYGKSIFGDKFVAVTDYMKADEYGKFLGSIDIAIFNNNRQQALGNIFALAYLGKKIFMRNDTTMWKDLVDDEGYKFSSIDEIEYMTFEKFIEINYDFIVCNKALSKNRFDEKYAAKVWNNIFQN